MKVQTIPDGFQSLSPYLALRGADKAIEFYRKAFGAKEVGRITMPDGTIGHCEMDLGNSKLMLAEENKQWGNLSPLSIGGSPVHLCLYVDDVDSVFAAAINYGAKVLGGMEVKDQYYGDRTGTLIDPFGYIWTVMTHIEDVSYSELQKRTNSMFK